MRYVFELGVEEIPARFLIKFESVMLDKFRKHLDKNNFKYDDVIYYATPRRLSFIIEGLESDTRLVDNKIYGPPKHIAFDHDGEPTAALTSFMTKNNIETQRNLQVDPIPPNKIFIDKTTGGKCIKEVLPIVMSEFVNEIKFSNEMKWGDGKYSFARPTRWILSLLDDEIIKISYNDIEASNKSFGIRHQGNKELTINDAMYYEDILEDNGIMVDHVDRYIKIESELNKIANKENAYYEPKEPLIYENVYLTEQANVAMHYIDEKYLKLPDKIISTSIAVHQKYFTLYSKINGILLNKYIFVYDLDPEHLDNVKKGTERVINARLNDALFFYENDTKVKFDTRTPKLSSIVYHNEVGTMKDKIDRMQKLFDVIKANSIYMAYEITNIEKTIQLCKNDLLTQVVGEKEFSSLQGYIGRVYAEKDTYCGQICKGIEEHYFPIKSGGALPSSLPGKIVSIIDKIDTLVAMFSINNEPKGNKDPYGLRRAVIGINRIVMTHEVDIDVLELITSSAKMHNCEDKISAIVEFYYKRVFIYLSNEQNINVNIINIVKDNIIKKPMSSDDLICTLVDYEKDEGFEKFLKIYKRIDGIVSKYGFTDYAIDFDLLTASSELELFYTHLHTSGKIYEDIRIKDYKASIDAFIDISTTLDKFFSNTIVIEKSEPLRNNRLKLLFLFHNMFNSLCNFGMLIK